HLSVFGRDDRGTSGLLMAILSITDATFTGFAGRLGERYHAHGKVCAVALGLLALGLAVIGATGNELGVAIGIAIVGLGVAGLGTSVLVLLGAITPADRRGTAAGMLQLCGDIGAMLGPLVGTAVFAQSTALPYLGTAGLMLAFVPVAVWLSRQTDGVSPRR
ncbi:MAG TPA: MFS transporter, partial [Kofleriaceae bacterium]